jgi:glycogen debranching enzyme
VSAPQHGRPPASTALELPLLSPDGWPYASSLPVDRDDPGRFHALFGRDSLITSLQVMSARPDVARATLRVLASMQATTEDVQTDEEPGKIVHEYRPDADHRFADMGWPVRDGELRYYGSADGTPWFLVLLAALGDRALAQELGPAWRGAADWLQRALARGGGLVRHGPRRAAGGLVQQGWRDTSDPLAAYGGGILNSDGMVPEPPLADADTQAVAVAGLRAAARLSGESRWQPLAAETVDVIAERFTPETIAIDRDANRVAGAGSHLGWLLWADALPRGLRAAYAQRLCEPDVLTDYGLRTLSSEHPQFAPDAYHRGAVWPFDSWLGWGGLRAAGREAEAERVRRGVLAALDRLGDAPELYAVTDDGPERIPIANRVQAWTIGARFALEQRYDGRPSADR